MNVAEPKKKKNANGQKMSYKMPISTLSERETNFFFFHIWHDKKGFSR